MVRAQPLKLILILTLATSACGLLTPGSDAPTAVPVPPTLTPIPELTADQIRNAQYQMNTREDHPLIQLTDGGYQQGTDPISPDFATATISDFIAFGDLNTDGVDEAAAIIYESFGGTGNFAALVVFRNENGLPLFVTSTFIDDRAIINGLSIEENVILLDAVVHAFDDPGCCPQLPTTRRYALVNDQLRLTHLTTSTPAGDIREIDIRAPLEGVEVSGSIQVTGSVTIAPFENNLAYSISDASGAEWATGPVQVIAPDLGAPGTFDVLIDLSGIPAGTMIFLELQDVSAADGSLLATDSVQLVVK